MNGSVVVGFVLFYFSFFIFDFDFFFFGGVLNNHEKIFKS